MGAAEPKTSRRAAETPKPPNRGRRMAHVLLLFVACVLVIDALVGDKGLLAMMQARKEHTQLSSEIARSRAENARLREEARRLREDPAAIEEIARRELGLIKPGEVMFIVKDVAPPGRSPK